MNRNNCIHCLGLIKKNGMVIGMSSVITHRLKTIRIRHKGERHNMFNFKWKKLGIIAGLSLSLVAAGCGQGDTGDTSEAEEEAGTNASEEMDYTITGLEPGAGQTELKEQAIEEYESLAGWEPQTSSTGSMLSALDEAMMNDEPIMITAWSPHYMFARWDIKYLEDPKGVFGEEIDAA